MRTNTLLVYIVCIEFLLIGCLARDEIIKTGRPTFYGLKANPAEFSYYVRLQKGPRVCGGTVVSNYYILTVARCIYRWECSAIEIFPSTWEEGQQPRFHADQCVCHNKYVEDRPAFDIAIIKTLEDLVEEAEFQAIRLTGTDSFYPSGMRATTLAWTQQSDNSLFHERLIRANVWIENWDTCNSLYKAASPPCTSIQYCPTNLLPNRVWCTVGQGQRQPVNCEGEVGGPVVINSVLVGVILGSFREERVQCKIIVPSLYTRVVDYLPWIYSFIDPGRDTSFYEVAAEP